MKKKTIIIIVLVIFLLAGIEIAIKALTRETNKYIENKKEEKAQEEIYNSPRETLKRATEDVAKSVLEALKEKNYDYVYESLEPLYKEAKFQNNKENMIAYINKNWLGDSYAITSSKFVTGSNSLMIGITSGDDYRTNYMTTTQDLLTDKTWVLLDDCVALVEEIPSSQTNNAIYSLKYSYMAGDYRQKVYIMEVLNVQNTALTLNMSEVEDATNSPQLKNTTYTIKPGEKLMVELKFIRNSFPDEIVRIVGTENGVPFELLITIEMDMRV